MKHSDLIAFYMLIERTSVPLNMVLLKLNFRASSASSNTSRADLKFAASSFPIPPYWLPCPVKARQTRGAECRTEASEETRLSCARDLIAGRIKLLRS